MKIWRNPIKEKNAPKWMLLFKGQIRSTDTLFGVIREIKKLSTPKKSPAIAEP